MPNQSINKQIINCFMKELHATRCFDKPIKSIQDNLNSFKTGINV